MDGTVATTVDAALAGPQAWICEYGPDGCHLFAGSTDESVCQHPGCDRTLVELVGPET